MKRSISFGIGASVVLVVFGSFLFLSLSFAFWEDPSAYEDDISRVRLEFGSGNNLSYIDITDPELVKFVVSRFLDSNESLGERRISKCQIRIYDADGWRNVSRPAWLYSEPWGFHVMTDIGMEEYKVFSLGNDIPERLKEALSLVQNRVDEQRNWDRGSVLRLELGPEIEQ